LKIVDSVLVGCIIYTLNFDNQHFDDIEIISSSLLAHASFYSCHSVHQRR